MGEVGGPGHAEPEGLGELGQNCSPLGNGRRYLLPVRKRGRGGARGSAWDARRQCPCPKRAGAPLPPGLVVWTKGDDEAGCGCTAWGLPALGGPAPGYRAASPSGPRGGAVARRRPGALPGRGWGRRGGRGEGGGKSAALPLAARSPAAPGGGSGSGGTARPGDRIPRPPSAPRGPDHGRQVGGLGERRAHVTEPPGHVTAAAGHGGAGWGPSCPAAGPHSGARGRRGGGARRGLDLSSLRGSGSVGRRSWEPWRSGILEGGVGGGGAACSPNGRPALEGTEGTCVARGAGPPPRREGAPPGPRRPPPGEREALCPGWAAAEGGGETPGPSPV